MSEHVSRLCRFPIPKLPSSAAARAAGVYTSGGLFAMGFYFFLDAAIYSKTKNASEIHIKFVDWLPLICSVLGMLVINSIKKSSLSGSDSFYDGSSVAWKARLVLFLGFALMAGGLAGGVTVLVLKYVVNGYPWPTAWMGWANVIANALIMGSCAVLWVAQNVEDEYHYSLQL